MKGDRERCLAAGMDDYVPKPLRGEALDAALARWLPPQNGEPARGEPIDLETLDRLRTELAGLGRPDAVETLIRQFLETVPAGVGALVAAADSGDPEEIAQQAHTLRGASSTFGAARLAAVCSELERAGRAGELEHARSLIPEVEEASAATRVALEEHLGAPATPQADGLPT
jgi:HPt (histidine-containing phosphotransfer) domain-containing protein